MYSRKRGVQRLFGDLVTTTGVAFDSDAGSLYHLDSCKFLINAFEWTSCGDICNIKMNYTFSKFRYYVFVHLFQVMAEFFSISEH